MTPTWVTVLVEVTAGVASGLLGTTLRISHDRGAELRSRMLSGADEFSIAVVAARQPMRSLAGWVLKWPHVQLVDPATGWYTAEFETKINVVNADIDEVLAKQTRVHPLLGDLSPAGISVTAIEHHLRLMDSSLTTRPTSLRDNGVRVRYSRNFTRVQEEQEAFNRAALDALRDTTPRRCVHWLSTVSRRPRRWWPWTRSAAPPTSI